MLTRIITSQSVKPVGHGLLRFATAGSPRFVAVGMPLDQIPVHHQPWPQISQSKNILSAVPVHSCHHVEWMLAAPFPVPHASFHPRGKRERLAVKMKMMMVIILLLLNDVLLPMLACLSQSSLIMMLCCSAWRGTKGGHTRSIRGRIGPGQFSQKFNSVFCMCRLLLCPPIPTYLPSVPIDSSRSLLLLIPGLQIPFHFIPISHTGSDEYALFGPRCCTFSVC